MRSRLMVMSRAFLLLAALIPFVSSGIAQGAVTVDFMLAVDDYAKLYVDGSEFLTWDTGGGAGNAYGTLALDPGLHDIRLDYANRYGSYGLMLAWKDPSETTYTPIPKTSFFSNDATGNLINGLRADYYQASLGNFTLYGEGPIQHNWTPMYQGVSGAPWAGVFSGWPIYFTETLTGQLQVEGAAVPEPTSFAMFAGLGVMGLVAARRRKRTA